MAGNRENPEENRKHQEVEVKLEFGHAPRLSQDWSLHRHQFQRLTRTKLRILWPWIENFEGSEKTWLWREWAQKEELGKKTRNVKTMHGAKRTDGKGIGGNMERLSYKDLEWMGMVITTQTAEHVRFSRGEFCTTSSRGELCTTISRGGVCTTSRVEMQGMRRWKDWSEGRARLA